jgi:hypothetical protein
VGNSSEDGFASCDLLKILGVLFIGVTIGELFAVGGAGCCGACGDADVIVGGCTAIVGPGRVIIGSRGRTGMYLRRNFRFLRVTRPEPSTRIMYWSYCLTSTTTPVRSHLVGLGPL